LAVANLVGPEDAAAAHFDQIAEDLDLYALPNLPPATYLGAAPSASQVQDVVTAIDDLMHHVGLGHLSVMSYLVEWLTEQSGAQGSAEARAWFMLRYADVSRWWNRQRNLRQCVVMLQRHFNLPPWP
jgi:hypothetical protein